MLTTMFTPTLCAIGSRGVRALKPPGAAATTLFSEQYARVRMGCFEPGDPLNCLAWLRSLRKHHVGDQ